MPESLAAETLDLSLFFFFFSGRLQVHGDKAGRPNGASYLGPVKLRKSSAGCFGCRLREKEVLFPADTQASDPEGVANPTSRGTLLTGETVPPIWAGLATRCG